MAGKSRRAKLTLSTGELAKLVQLSRSRNVPKRETQRSEVLLRYHAGKDITRISRSLKMTRASVTKWVSRFEQVWRHRASLFRGMPVIGLSRG